MADVSSELVRFLSDAEKWVKAHQAIVGILLTVVPIASIARFIVTHRKNEPGIEFELEHVDEIAGNNNMGVVLKVTNFGGSAATKVRYTWTRRSGCTMTPVPQPFMLLQNDSRRFEFSVRPAELIWRLTESKEHQILGWLELTYNAGGHLWTRVGHAIVMSDNADVAVDLAPIPRKILGEIIPLLGQWRNKRLRDRDVHNFTQWLQDSRAYLVERGIQVECLEGDDGFHRLLGELGGRGWTWNFGPGGRGYEVHAEKHWPPSSHMSIRLSAETTIDAATLVLASAN